MPAGLKVPRSPSSPAGLHAIAGLKSGSMATLSVPLTGAQHDIAAGDYRATITELGAGLRALRYRDAPVIVEYGDDELPPAGAGQLLAPWPNRIDHGQYSFGGASYQLDLSEPAHGNAIHGLTRWTGWQLIDIAADSAELGLRLLGRPGYPFCLELRARYRLSADRRPGGHGDRAQRRRPPSPVRHRLASVPDASATAVVDDLRSWSCPPPAGCPPTSAASRPARRQT